MDHHFLVRYSFTGVIFLLFTLAGLWAVNDGAAIALMQQFAGSNMQVGPAIISAVATVPVIGVVLHGIYLVSNYLASGHSFSDEARKQVALHIRNEADALDDRWKKHFKKEGETVLPDDSLFVWLYYFDAPPHLIEWARRRRDYFYLGMSWAMAVGLGLVSGMAAGLLVYAHTGVGVRLAPAPKLCYVVLLFIFSAGFAAGSSWLGRQMKRDADAMELVWATARLNKNLHRQLAPKTFDGVDVSLKWDGLGGGVGELTAAVGGGLAHIGDAIETSARSLQEPVQSYLSSQPQGHMGGKLDELQTTLDRRLGEMSSAIESLRASAGPPAAPAEGAAGGKVPPTDPGSAI